MTDLDNLFAPQPPEPSDVTADSGLGSGLVAGPDEGMEPPVSLEESVRIGRTGYTWICDPGMGLAVVAAELALLRREIVRLTQTIAGRP